MDFKCGKLIVNLLTVFVHLVPIPQEGPHLVPQLAPQPASQPVLQPSVQHIQNEQCTQHSQPSQVPYASCRSTPDHQAPLYQPSPALYTQYEPVQTPLTQSTPQNEHYQDIGLLTEFEQYQNGHLQNEQYPNIRDGFYDSPGDYHMSVCNPPIHQPWYWK